MILKTLNLLNKKIEVLKNKYDKNKIGIVVATTNSGVEEFEKTKQLYEDYIDETPPKKPKPETDIAWKVGDTVCIDEMEALLHALRAR